MARYPSSGVGYAIGPGGISPAVKILIIANVVLFALNVIVGDAMTIALGLSPQEAREAIVALPAEDDRPVEELLRTALQGVGRP